MTSESEGAEAAPLSEEVIAEVRAVYSDQVIDHAMNPRHVGEIDDPDGFAATAGPCGDVMEMWLRVSGGRIEEARFWTSGCATTIAAGSMTADLATGMTLEEALRINPARILRALGGLPEENRECAVMASRTLRGAVMDYLEIEREPWRRGYRRR